MSQHDMDVANQAGAAFRADLNAALQAIASQQSGSTQPPATFAYQLWADTSAGVLRMRNAANNAWITVGVLGVANLGHILPGTVAYFAASSPPAGYLKTNGAAVSRSTYSDLYAAIGTLFGAGDGSNTFNVPDLRGEFLRGWDDGRGLDVGRGLGTLQQEMVGPHTHNTVTAASGVTSGAESIAYMPGDNNGRFTVISNSMHGVQPNTGTENRPRNIALLACIKY
ncbi:Phage tail fiber protein [Cupriavidus sp. U2]|uniref:phage tail protein n=1 Tax=Cupriavidus sp. U2 TaxID=2920269 RepID=UPI00129DC0A3|nr:Phage tail fiber protein [Cupriavidus sp. U2]